jgi:hypothetical protein
MRSTPERRVWLAALIILAGGFIAGCGGNSHEASPMTSVVRTVGAASTQAARADKHELGQEYLPIVAPENAALDIFNKKEKSYDRNTRAEEVTSDLAPVIAAFQEADDALLRVDWPPSIGADVKALITANVALIADLRAADSYRVLSSTSWTTQTYQHVVKVDAAANKVRADLGLPPVKP